MAGYFYTLYISPTVGFASSDKSIGIATTAPIATRTYTALASRVPAPKINATRSKLKMPTSPQLRPPIISSASAILFSIFITPSLFGYYYPRTLFYAMCKFLPTAFDIINYVIYL